MAMHDLKPAEKLRLPHLTRIVESCLKNRPNTRVTRSMMFAVALSTTGAANIYNCTGCKEVDDAVRTAFILTGCPEATIKLACSYSSANEGRLYCKFHVEQDRISLRSCCTDNRLIALGYGFVLSARWGMFAVPASRILIPVEQALWESTFTEFKRNIEAQCFYSIDWLDACLREADRENPTLAFSLYADDGDTRVNQFGAAIERTYIRIKRSFGEV